MTLWVLAALAGMTLLCLVAGVRAIQGRRYIAGAVALGAALGALLRFGGLLR